MSSFPIVELLARSCACDFCIDITDAEIHLLSGRIGRDLVCLSQETTAIVDLKHLIEFYDDLLRTWNRTPNHSWSLHLSSLNLEVIEGSFVPRGVASATSSVQDVHSSLTPESHSVTPEIDISQKLDRPELDINVGVFHSDSSDDNIQVTIENIPSCSLSEVQNLSAQKVRRRRRKRKTCFQEMTSSKLAKHLELDSSDVPVSSLGSNIVSMDTDHSAVSAADSSIPSSSGSVIMRRPSQFCGSILRFNNSGVPMILSRTVASRMRYVPLRYWKGDYRPLDDIFATTNPPSVGKRRIKDEQAYLRTNLVAMLKSNSANLSYKIARRNSDHPQVVLA